MADRRVQTIREDLREDTAVAFAPYGRKASLTSTANQRTDADFARTSDGWPIACLAFA